MGQQIIRRETRDIATVLNHCARCDSVFEFPGASTPRQFVTEWKKSRSLWVFGVAEAALICAYIMTSEPAYLIGIFAILPAWFVASRLLLFGIAGALVRGTCISSVLAFSCVLVVGILVGGGGYMVVEWLNLTVEQRGNALLLFKILLVASIGFAVVNGIRQTAQDVIVAIKARFR
jgi:hypothetical protein